eukprot:scaffold12978_cov69-Cylindrotheca_fusiformis.AAC.1
MNSFFSITASHVILISSATAPNPSGHRNDATRHYWISRFTSDSLDPQGLHNLGHIGCRNLTRHCFRIQSTPGSLAMLAHCPCDINAMTNSV